MSNPTAAQITNAGTTNDGTGTWVAERTDPSGHTVVVGLNFATEAEAFEAAIYADNMAAHWSN